MSRTAYWIIGVVVVGLCVAGLIAYSAGNENERAQQKAQELSQKLARVGARVPDKDIIVRSLGDDGGAVCENAEDGLDGLNKAILFDQFVNGADFVGRRPVTVDRRVVLGQLLILETYCPEHLEEFRDKVDDLEYDDVIRD
jgi:hypothetical protein